MSLSSDSSSSESCSSSSESLLGDNLNPENIQGYQFQPRRDSYTKSDESNESEHHHGERSDSDEPKSVPRLGNLDW